MIEWMNEWTHNVSNKWKYWSVWERFSVARVCVNWSQSSPEHSGEVQPTQTSFRWVCGFTSFCPREHCELSMSGSRFWNKPAQSFSGSLRAYVWVCEDGRVCLRLLGSIVWYGSVQSCFFACRHHSTTSVVFIALEQFWDMNHGLWLWVHEYLSICLKYCAYVSSKKQHPEDMLLSNTCFFLWEFTLGCYVERDI